MRPCIFPDCTNGDCSLDAFRACTRCCTVKPQQDRHVQDYYFRKRTGLMVVRPYRIVAAAQS